MYVDTVLDTLILKVLRFLFRRKSYGIMTTRGKTPGRFMRKRVTTVETRIGQWVGPLFLHR